MRWRGRRQSDNVEDRRMSGGGKAAVGGGMGLMIIAVIVALMGGNPQKFLQQAKQRQAAAAPKQQGGDVKELSAAEKERGEFAKTVLADTEDAWTQIFAQSNQKYSPPTMVLFSGQVQSACGFASAASGPFYCPADRKVYLDTTFFTQLSQQLGAPGDFAQAYVIAHEVGHHVQNLLGYTKRVDQVRRTQSKEAANKASVRLELQADFLAGCMLHHAQRTKNIIEPGDVEEALNAATAIGDDRLQQRSQGYVVPESFTHGTSDQRLRWFMKGLKTGDLSQGNTFDISEAEL